MVVVFNDAAKVDRLGRFFFVGRNARARVNIETTTYIITSDGCKPWNRRSLMNTNASIVGDGA